MKYLLDTHLLLWAAEFSTTIERTGRLSAAAVALIKDPANELIFSAVSIWEVAIKAGRGRPDFAVNPHLLRRGLLDNGYVELAVTGAHAAAVMGLPDHHKDPFDRLLVAQATIEGVTLVTADARLAGYPGPVLRV
ncbi:type II toxin-antitoxin system VapC family toxin [Inquilinus limosus]|uniref:PIN domain nuclease n=1 Tax=Inquilinus limosus TaxID=171674 RepID=A0A211ZPA1_9PROT|nr:type II toxin-antitoxin system VapC family toxin [Inquilinus limosus]OWJ66994.1 PIN domain nuclease [Inquilinus limosus]